jgi:hypothetical protein
VRATQGRNLRSPVAAVADDAFDEWEALPGLPQQRFASVGILDMGPMDVDVQQQAERVDEDVTLAPENLLPRIIPAGIKRTPPPFSGPLALCASIIAVVGQASRPACSRL